MKEHPILFSTDMVKAILEGRKTQTRRVNKLEGLDGDSPYYETREGDLVPINDMCPYGQVGDRLWVRETWNAFPLFYDGYNGGMEIEYQYEPIPKTKPDGKHCVIYKASHNDLEMKWRPSIFMPRWASRITLEITDIRVQRLQEISPNDCRDEGVEPFLYTINYRKLWDKINGKKYPWVSNPFVWAITFKLLEN